ncbi:hypothetical protein A2955_03580 [Candidatus Woesebacteria bacterium RIFCSPLOWO2_01_FULL_37_19]|uniref:Uncharacterized protein n=2 Tax=Candidatus Woeseibacteriota TaxID=1752722 RepID=A0A1F8B6X9_9BACT|nr:MAG: hypothetical protein A2771_02575 [Candidatus Woesebacteria bacterium RIFCSPHIGHO2_01_FULL_38_26b]OGM59806.1 MAG: hypothetical protein A2955_03580 [Candidatus Woesebacteria bacterium RIFCSPLOWO2_01_FULL_37_19]
MGIDVRIGREATYGRWTVSILLNLNPEPAIWFFQLMRQDPETGRQFVLVGGQPVGKTMDAPIEHKGAELLNWLKLVGVPESIVWQLYRKTLTAIGEMVAEEIDARAGHELVTRVMSQ